MLSRYAVLSRLNPQCRLILAHLEHAKDSGLMAFQSKEVELYRQSASYVDEILKGAKPADLPIQPEPGHLLGTHGPHHHWPSQSRRRA